MTDKLTLGSGTVYVLAYTGAAIPADASLEIEANILGYIKGGASVEVKPSEYELFDDGYNVHKRYTTGEEITFKTGVITWNVETLSKLTANGTYTDDTVTHKRTLKIGTKGVAEMTKFIIRFVQTDGESILRITLVGTPSSGFSLAFAMDKETIIDAEFKAMSHGDGEKLTIEETYEV